ncbi:MAG: hypothetical protein SV765_02695 [Pseudomonadota bacterium]|nr:hypothetical protein [Pseudomonadota bacterium]
MISDWFSQLAHKISKALLAILFASALFVCLCLSLSFCVYLTLSQWLVPLYAALGTALVQILILAMMIYRLQHASSGNGRKHSRKSAGKEASRPPLPMPSLSGQQPEETLALCLVAGYLSQSQPDASTRWLVSALNSESNREPQHE